MGPTRGEWWKSVIFAGKRLHCRQLSEDDSAS
jgi:hypothetical protein